MWKILLFLNSCCYYYYYDENIDLFHFALEGKAGGKGTRKEAIKALQVKEAGSWNEGLRSAAIPER